VGLKQSFLLDGLRPEHQPCNGVARLGILTLRLSAREDCVVHYYQHHIGDFIKATARLTDAQSMAYLRLIWMYYDQERPLPDDVESLAFQLGADEKTIHLILVSYFKLEDGQWKHTRCDEEISGYRTRSEQASKAGRASAERRFNTRSTSVEQTPNDPSTFCQPTNNHITNNQEPKEKTIVASQRFEEFWKAYPSDRKQAKKPCMDKWAKLKLDEMADKVISHVESLKRSKSWRDGYSPAPLTYLSQQRWIDGEPEVTEDFKWT
jgi:uncharacterized protein YdaU (DUF1376 family)